MNITKDRVRVVRVVKDGFATLRRMFPDAGWRIGTSTPTQAFTAASVVARERGFKPDDARTMELLALLSDAHAVTWGDLGVEIVDACDATTREYGA